jgi:hypothetical protein
VRGTSRAIVNADHFNVMHPVRFVTLFLLVAACALADPARQGGVSAHMLPKRVADLGDMKWGFVISYAEYLKPETEKPVIQSAAGLVAFLKKQDKGVQDNGMWIVITNPAAYSESELALLEDVKKAFRREHLPLFICRGADLPNGWKRSDTDA